MSSDGLQPPSSSTALFTPVVLECLFTMQDTKDLMACRLVCKSWAKEGGRILGKRLDENKKTLDQLKSLNEIQKHADVALRLQMLYVEVPFSFDISKFFSSSYGSVKSLTLQCFPSLVPHFLLQNFPNLESLCYLHDWTYEDVYSEVPSADVWDQCTLSLLRNIKLYSIPRKSRWINLWSKLVEKAVKLEYLGVYYTDVRTADTLILKVCSPNFKRTSRVDLLFSKTPFVALCTHPINFPLETIKLTGLKGSIISKLDMKLLLTRYSSTLSELLLRFEQTFEMDFPLGVRMKSLHKLKIKRLCGSMEWTNLPKLRDLTLERSNFEGIASSISSAPTVCHLEALNIDEVNEEMDEFVPMFREIAEHLGPQLKSLELSNAYSEALLPVIFDKLTQLRRLSLRGFERVPPKITNINLCGGDSFTFRRPREGINGPPLKTLYKRMIASARKSSRARGPNITNLKDLQFLRLSSEFSEVAVLYGIVHCEMLKEVILDFPVSPETRDSMVHLFVNAGLKHLTTVYLNRERRNHLSFTPEGANSG